MLENISDVICVLGADGTFLYVSPAIEKVLGYLPEDLFGAVSFDYVYPDDAAFVAESFAGILQTRGVHAPVEFRAQAADGSVLHVQAVPNNQLDNPALRGVVITFRDLTERVRVEEEVRLQARLLDVVGQAVIATNLEGKVVYWNRAAEEIYGWSKEEVMDQTLSEFVIFEDLIEWAAEIRTALGEGDAWSGEVKVQRKDGTTFLAMVTSTPVHDERGILVGMIGVSTDITERKEAEEQLRTSEAELRALFAAMDDVVFEIDVQGRYLKVAPTNPSLLYPTREDRIGKTLHDILPAKKAEELLGHIQHSVESRETVKVEYSLVIEGKEKWFEGTVTPLSRESVVFVGRDITERKVLEERLAHQALHDPLTKLPNRTLFTDRLRQALARVRRRGLSLAVMFMDLDNFKVINDSLGHRMGDRLLVTASKRIRSVLRPEDTVARLGGDELVILLEDTDLDGAIHVAERILEKLRVPFSLGGRQLFVTASLGITVGDGNGKNAPDLLRDADLAMYRAKHSGKARYAIFEETMNTRALERLELEHDLRRAVERNEFVVHYQPNVSLATGKIVGFEALARWEHPERGLLSPDKFVRVAEETGLIVPIGEAVLKEACRQAKDWHERCPSDPPAVCVNLSARQFWEPGLAETVGRILEDTDLDPHYLCLEVTENTAMSDAPATTATLEVLRDLGVRAIIDDFGTGYSSLSYLERFPVDYVKIDRSFVGGLGEESGAAVLASGVISLAHALSLKVIAEGVETEEQLERLREMGCDLAQGHLFSEPLTVKAATNLLIFAHYRNPLGSS